MIILGQKIEAVPVRCEKCKKCSPLYRYARKRLCRYCLESVVLDEMG